MEAIDAPWPAAVGVSGGSDSLALALLLRDWAQARGLAKPIALCVDHRVRTDSAAEARRVAARLRRIGLPAHVLTGDVAPPESDIEGACRTLRYRLIGEWTLRHRLGAAYVAHTQDDQAETFLLRLARGSGVDGLAAMQALAPFPDPECARLRLVRPLLTFSRQELRTYLTSRGLSWIDDPMNLDPRFARARIRNAWGQLAELGITPARLAEAAAHLGRARQALDAAAFAVIVRAFTPCHQGAALDPAALSGAPRELALRALARILMMVGKQPYRPRFERLNALFEAIIGGSLGNGRTLHGCRIAPAPKKLAVFGGNTLVIQAEKVRRTAGKAKS